MSLINDNHFYVYCVSVCLGEYICFLSFLSPVESCYSTSVLVLNYELNVRGGYVAGRTEREREKERDRERFMVSDTLMLIFHLARGINQDFEH